MICSGKEIFKLNASYKMMFLFSDFSFCFIFDREVVIRFFVVNKNSPVASLCSLL